MNPIELFQLDLGGRIKADCYFKDKPCFVYRPRAKMALSAIDTQVNNTLYSRLKLGGHSGVAIAVFMPVGDIPDADPYSPEFDLTCTVRISENVLINMSPGGTQQTAEDIGLQLVMLLRNFRAEGLYQTVTCGKEALTPVGTLADDDNVLIYDMKFTTRFGLSAKRKTVSPAISGTYEAVTLTNQDKCADAQLYYTTDLSYPRPPLTGDPDTNTSTLYAGVFAVPQGTTVRAAAYAPHKKPSDVSAAQFLDALAAENGDVLITDQGFVLTI